MATPQAGLLDLLATAAVVPVLAIESIDSALPLARALAAGGLPVLEITLRTPAALAIIRAITQEVEGAVVGAGTVLTPEQYRDAARAGARSVHSYICSLCADSQFTALSPRNSHDRLS